MDRYRSLVVSGKRYVSLLVDEYTRKRFIRFLNSKAEAGDSIKRMVREMIYDYPNNRIKVIRTDGGKEYFGSHVKEYCGRMLIRHEVTPPYTPEHNGVAERHNGLIVDKARSLLKGANLPLNFWAEAMATAVYILNRCPTRSRGGEVPEELWTGDKVNVEKLKTFGCICYALVPK